MGQYFVDRTHYTKTDHFVCMPEGLAQLRLVPHIYLHEMYAGKSFLEDDWHNPGKTKDMELMMRESPINLFDLDYSIFPKAKHIIKEHIYNVFLRKGDCIFIPAFYFYQFAAEGEA